MMRAHPAHALIFVQKYRKTYARTAVRSMPLNLAYIYAFEFGLYLIWLLPWCESVPCWMVLNLLIFHI